MSEHSAPVHEPREPNSAVVHTKDLKYEPERLVKHERYVLMIWKDRKKSVPWERIQEVNEPL